MLGVAVTAIVLVACRDDENGRGTDEFCAQVTEHQAALFRGPAEQTRQAYEDLVELYRDIGELAPLAIEEEWTAMAELWETALEEADEQEVLRRSYTSERDAVAVVDWVEENCSVTVPLATVPPLVAPPGTEAAAADG